MIFQKAVSLKEGLPMRRKIFSSEILFCAFVLLCVYSPLSFANGLAESASLTPQERLRINALKAKDNPSLRGRWNPKSYELATQASYIADNLAMQILSSLRTDETLSRRPMLLKIRSKNGTVALEGVVNDDAEKSLIEEKVSRMDGVKKIENRLKVKTQDRDLLGE